MSKIRVAVLMGGRSSERAVSLSTGKMILDALDTSKYEAFPVDAALFGCNAARKLEAGGDCEIAALSEAQQAVESLGQIGTVDDMVRADRKPDVAFIALHGKYGEDGTVQGLLELAGIPYTGSGVLASALAMDKILTKKVLAAGCVPVLPSVELMSRMGIDTAAIVKDVEKLIGYPVIVKPNCQGSTIGMCKAESSHQLVEALNTAFAYDDKVMIEKFITGTEITVGVLGVDQLEALPIVEIVPAAGFYDYEAKYTPGATEEIVPARIAENTAEEARRLALASHIILGCRGMSRTDMMVTEEGLYVLEVNTIPGMTPTSLLPRAAQAAGIPFPDLLDRLISYALEG